jgi:hypothetical protein
MSDLRTLMHQSVDLVPTAVETSAVDADLARGRQALRRRRARRTSAGSGLLVAAAVGAMAVVSNGLQPSLDRPSTPTSTVQPDRGAAIEMVAYTGSQPSGYVLDKVPAGWTVRDDTASVLTLAPADAATPDAGPQGTISFEGTIAISTEADTNLPTGVQLDDVDVAGVPAVIAHLKGAGDTRALFLTQPSGAHLVIQVWDGLNWDNDQIAQFASSVHVTDGAQVSVG